MIGTLLQSSDTEDDGRADWPVLKNAPLRVGYDQDVLSRYGDAVWNLTPAVFRENARRCHCTVKFNTLVDPVMADTMRAYLHARLNVRIPGWSNPLPPASIRQAFNNIRPFFEFVLDELGVLNLALVNQALLDRYAKAVIASKQRQPAANALLLKSIWHLYHYRDHLPRGGLRFEPWPGQNSASVAGYSFQSQENLTARIPEPILAPLLEWAFKYVQVFSADIFSAHAELSALEARASRLTKTDRDRPRDQIAALHRTRIERWLAMRRREGRGVPVWAQPTNGITREGTTSTPINWHLLNLVAGVDARQNPGGHLSLQRTIRQMVERNEVQHGTELGGFDTPISLDPNTGHPWRSGFDHLALKREERMLQTAGYIICAYLTGMRDCEVQAMRSNCLDITRSEDGLIERYRVHSTTYKSKSASGSPADWITIAPVAEAIGVLKRLSQAACAAHGTDTLWPVLDPAPDGKTHVSAEIVKHLNEFREHINSRLDRSDPARSIPTMHNGKFFRITTRQFRRTLAWHIANRPFGTIAGMIQYKHTSVAVFEGYAGTSASGFLRQVDQERRLGQLDDILEYFEAYQVGDNFGGPTAHRLKASLLDVANQLDPLPASIADRGRLRALLSSLARTLHVGVLADCFFDPTTALCLNTNSDHRKPQTALCQPTKCPNACIRARHLPAWRRAAKDAKLLLKEKRLSDLQRSSLQADYARILNVIRCVDLQK